MQTMIDASEATQKAVDMLMATLAEFAKKNKKLLAELRIIPLPKFVELAGRNQMTDFDKLNICSQAILLLEQFYAHFKFKRARYAVDPVQRIKLLREDCPNKEDILFHSEIIKVFAELRDVHTQYGLPRPYRASVAFLPFFVEYFHDDKGIKHYLVSEILDGFNPDPTEGFKSYTEVTAFNGVPIDLAIDILAQQIPGGNEATRTIRGTMRLTVRSLSTCVPPDAHIAYIEYLAPRSDGKMELRTIAVPWYVGIGFGFGDLKAVAKKTSTNSVCGPLADLARVKSLLWKHSELDHASQPVVANSFELTLPELFEVHHSVEAEPAENPELLDEHLSWSKRLGGKKRRFGYVRIKSFATEDAGPIRDEFFNILQWFNENQFATEGLILDVRSNPGGSIQDAEGILQFLTPAPITPALFHYPNSHAVQSALAAAKDPQEGKISNKLSNSLDFIKSQFADWTDGLAVGVGSGTPITDGRRITSVKDANNVGQLYQGPVTLLIDAASYSATDIFSGGFQDHGIGPIIGADDNTGGGGAKLWKHEADVEQLAPALGMGIEALPQGATFTTAICRSSRVLGNSMEPVEDVGVKCDLRHKLTYVDRVVGSKDLLAFAMKTLDKLPSHRLQIENCERKAKGLRVTVKASTNVERLVFLVDGVPQFVAQLKAIKPTAKQLRDDLGMINRSFTAPSEAISKKTHEVELQGFARCRVLRNGQKNTDSKLELVASSRFHLPRAKKQQ